MLSVNASLFPSRYLRDFYLSYRSSSVTHPVINSSLSQNATCMPSMLTRASSDSGLPPVCRLPSNPKSVQRVVNLTSSQGRWHFVHRQRYQTIKTTPTGATWMRDLFHSHNSDRGWVAPHPTWHYYPPMCGNASTKWTASCRMHWSWPKIQGTNRWSTTTASQNHHRPWTCQEPKQESWRWESSPRTPITSYSDMTPSEALCPFWH